MTEQASRLEAFRAMTASLILTALRRQAFLLASAGLLAASAAAAQVDPPSQPRGPAYSPPQPAAPGGGDQAPNTFSAKPDQVAAAVLAARRSALDQPADQAVVHRQAGELAHAGQIAAVRAQAERYAPARRIARSRRSLQPATP
jgi:hypothetical protein